MKNRCEGCPFEGQTIIEGEGTITEGSRLLAVKEPRTWPVVVVGMAPAEEEIRQQRPLIGPSGMMLRKLLYQFEVKEYYLTNVLQCRIEDDKGEKEAIAHCRNRLFDEIKAVQPKLIITLGDMPLHVLADTDYNIRELEGRVLPTKHGALLPLAHPAYYLRNPRQAMDFVECLRSGLRVLDGTYGQAVDVTRIVADHNNLQQILNELSRADIMSVDLETSGFFAYGTHPDHILEAGISASPSHSYIVPAELLPEFKNLLEEKKCLFWHARFDCSFLKAIGITPNVYYDGMLAHYCLDERTHSHGLKRVARIYLGSEDWEKNINQYLPNKKTSTYELIPREVRYEYLSKDSARTFQLWQTLKGEVKDNWVFWNIIMPGTRMFIEIEERGIPLDSKKIMEMNTYLEEETETLEKELWEIAGESFNPASPKQCSEIIYYKMGIPINPKYGPSTNKNLLEDYREDYPFVDKLIQWREARHDQTNYVTGFVQRMDHDFRVHPSIKMFGTVTGRLASESPSIMNIKSASRVKELFLPEPGQLIAEFDFKQMELRWYYMYSQDKLLKDILTNGYQQDFGFELSKGERMDPHFVIGMQAYHDKEKAIRKRVVTKSMVFGRMYGRGKKSFIEGGQRTRRGVFEDAVTMEEVDNLMNVIDDTFPGLKAYANVQAGLARTRGYVESYFGRKRRFPLVNKENQGEVERQARNMPIQSAASDLNLLCLMHLWDNRHKWNIFPMFAVHDSIIVSIPNREILPILKEEIEKKAKEVVKGEIDFPVDAKCGPSWGETK